MKRRIILLISALIISINVNAQLDRSIQPKGGPTPKIKLEKPQEFKKRSEVEKDRNRLLEEKFKEAQKNVDKSVDIPLRDIDLD